MRLRADFLEHHAVSPASVINTLKTLATKPSARTLAVPRIGAQPSVIPFAGFHLSWNT
jgi:hypothetical protein